MSKGGGKKKVDSYLKYSGLAFQLAGVIFFSIYIGKWLDGYFATDKPYYTMLLTLLLFGAYLYKLVKDLS